MRLLLFIASVLAPRCMECRHPLRMHVRHIGQRRKDCGYTKRCTGPTASSPNSETCLCDGYVQEE